MALCTPAPSTRAMANSSSLSCVRSDACEEAVKWVMANVYKPGDELHLIHVIPRLQLAATYGAPPVDFLPYQVRLAE